jgi:hypothetical protein
MATSTCIKCGGTRFELKTNDILGSNFMINFIQCSSCGGVVGAMDYFAVGVYVKAIAEHLKIKVD